MPSNLVDPDFQQALRDAIRRFREAKEPLWSHHIAEIAIMEAVVNNNHQTNRELRDGVQRASYEINRSWWNLISGSLLVDYTGVVLKNPRFNVERMYEALIDHKEEIIELQSGLIVKLKEENNRYKEDSKWYVNELQAELKEKDTIIINAMRQQKQTEEKLDQYTKVIQVLENKLEGREKDYQALCAYTQKLEKNDFAKKQFKTLNPQVGDHPKGLNEARSVPQKLTIKPC